MRRVHGTAGPFEIVPLGLPMLALVLVSGIAFFRTDFWLLGAAFIAGGFLVVSALFYLSSVHTRRSGAPIVGRWTVHRNSLVIGTVIALLGGFTFLAAADDLGRMDVGGFVVPLAQTGFSMMIVGGFWVVLSLRG